MSRAAVKARLIHLTGVFPADRGRLLCTGSIGIALAGAAGGLAVFRLWYWSWVTGVIAVAFGISTVAFLYNARQALDLTARALSTDLDKDYKKLCRGFWE